MTLVGKIFVVAIFAMSVLWMGLAMAVYTVHRDLREDILRPAPDGGKELGYKYQIEDAKKKIEELNLQVDGLSKRLADITKSEAQQRAKLESAKVALEEQNTTLRADIEKLQAESAEKIALAASTQQQVTRVTEQEGKLREEIRETILDRDKQFAKIVDSTDKLHDEHSKVVRLEERKRQLEEQIVHYKGKLTDLGVKNPDEPIAGAPPAIEGQVTAVNKNDLIEISIGSDDGVKIGHTLHVYRAGRAYLGRVQIVQTAPDRAVAKIIKDSRTGNIQKGDRVATSLKVS